MNNEPGTFLRTNAEMAALLQEIKVNPEEDGPRLIFSDWLEERGDPRGTLMRLQCEMAPMPDDGLRRTTLRRQEQKLIHTVKNWLQPEAQWLYDWRCQRGLWSVRVNLLVHARNAWSRLTTSHWWDWVDSLRVELLPEQQLAEVAGSPALATLNTLNLNQINLGARGAGLLAQSEHLCNLTSLSLQRTGLTIREVQALANSQHLSRLRSLDLSGNESLGDRGVTALTTGALTRLLRIYLDGTDVTPKGVGALRARFGQECFIFV